MTWGFFILSLACWSILTLRGLTFDGWLHVIPGAFLLFVLFEYLRWSRGE